VRTRAVPGILQSSAKICLHKYDLKQDPIVRANPAHSRFLPAGNVKTLVSLILKGQGRAIHAMLLEELL
jgi:hypothetical protein